MARNNQRAQQLNGLFPLSYMGVVPVSPPNIIIENRAPTSNDLSYIGDIWLNNVSYPIAPKSSDIYMLVSVVGNVATWVNFGSLETLSGNIGTNPVFPVNGNINVFGDGTTVNVSGDGINTLTVSAAGGLATTYPTDFTSPAVPIAGVLNIFGGTSSDSEQVALVYRHNIHTAAVNNTVFVKLNESISLPNTIASGEAGVIYMGGVSAADRFMHNFGTSANTFLGAEAGNFTNASQNNTGIGIRSLRSLTVAGNSNSGFGSFSLNACTTGAFNTGLGNISLSALTTGDFNTAVGNDTLSALDTGDGNIALGTSAGNTYTTNESNNIVIGNVGVVGDNDAIRIGNTQTTAYFAGINGNTTASPTFVTVDTVSNQLGVGTPYVTNSWTPQISIGGSTVGITYSLNSGNYMLFKAAGQMSVILLAGRITLSSLGGLAGTVQLINLPFSAFSSFEATYNPINMYGGITLPANATFVSMGSNPPNPTASFIVNYVDGSASTFLQASALTNTSDFAFGWFFTVTA